MFRNTLLGFVLPLAFHSASPADASEPLAIEWNDLLPSKHFEDPFEKLSRKQLQDLSYVARIRKLLATKRISPDGLDAKEATKIEQKLNKGGIDIGWMMSQYDRVRWMREKQAKAVQKSMVGKVIILAGYVVPLKQSGDLVTEFLLVPNVDACSHVIPPPPNQIVFVRSRESFASRGRIAAVRVIGQIEAEETTRVIQRADGPTHITAAYAISSDSMKVYSVTK